MMTKGLESRLSAVLAWGALAVTLVVTDRIGTDPVNIGKMVLLSVVAFSLTPFIVRNFKTLVIREKILITSLLVFFVLLVISIFTSTNTFERGLYGAFSRNTGLLTYASLVLILLAATLVSLDQSFSKVIKALFIAGIINIIYCLFAASGKDVFTWSNPYNAVLGTFGNPNFIGTFMGIFFTLLAVQILDPSQTVKGRVVRIVLLPLTLVIVDLSNALQGVLVSAFGAIFALYFYLRSKERLSKFSILFLLVIFGGAIVGLLGILKKGPLASLLYKPSVTFRGEYWKTAINMGTDHPFSGVGIDSYGVFFRTYRELSATVFPGMDTTTDTAHNVYLDILAGVGFPGFIAYCLISGVVFFTGLKYLKKFKSFDGKFLTIFLCWAAYQLQSIISINQIGLAIWGWLLGGLVIAYVRTHPDGVTTDLAKVASTTNSKIKKAKQETQLIDTSIFLQITVGAVVGLLIAMPPFYTDAKMRKIQSGQATSDDITALGKSWPNDNSRINRLIVLLAQNNLNEQAKQLATFGTVKFPNDFASWLALYELTPDGTAEKLAYKEKLHEIDPFNPKYFKK
jgi:O-antigen ligase